jgi:hypothetical protein
LFLVETEEGEKLLCETGYWGYDDSVPTQQPKSRTKSGNNHHQHHHDTAPPVNSYRTIPPKAHTHNNNNNNKNRTVGALKGYCSGNSKRSTNLPPLYGESGGPFMVTCHLKISS